MLLLFPDVLVGILVLPIQWPNIEINVYDITVSFFQPNFNMLPQALYVYLSLYMFVSANWVVI